ncbi:sensor histidine kinase [Pseudoprimorskyibacter insulae]|uniref:histidine kinase n=1 Tax=Pseudoprimorskyibacter insulae TaxID=1695997 RepID=A0A2R8AZ44_9RHOB|nr:ATP-binding protein [Pseudoprimorskyibacter insulae]SPF81280.1 Alkaline phosphatase synthesis sensor protein PhoR [Pseudoprimorskyibacter insulae]
MNEQMLQDLVEAIPMPAILIRMNERIEAANAEARKLLGEAIVQRHFITALRQPVLLDAIEATQKDGKPRKTDYLTNDGRNDTTFRVTVRPVSLPSGRGTLICFEDITHLEKAGQMRRDFVANVSHELRTPLTALIGFIETLKGPAKNDTAALERFLTIMDSEAGRMNRLVGDLLSLSRVEADERVRPTDPVDPVALISSTVNGLMPVAESCKASVTLDVPSKPIRILGDSDQLRQVFTNLIENAIKYGGTGVNVAVSLTEPTYESRLRGQAVRLTVRDNGPGIDEVHLPRLTERFYRADSHRSRHLGGTGLGLAIVKHIVNRHRGRMWIESTLGQGTKITVLLRVD